jgi:serine/threonine protein kinase
VETLAPDQVLGGRYRLRRQLARGGMATVWEAEDRILTRRVAIKVLHPHLAGDDGFRARFRREAVSAAGLAHPHIVTTYDTGRDSDVAYIVMELVEGTTLARLLKARGPLPVDKAVDIAAQVADALACAHEHGVIHRDVKPANILLRGDGHVKVADFGIAKAGAGNDLTRTGVVMGTAKYLSPEQVSGSPADALSDIYALGIVLYEMLCGQPPFVGETDLSTAVARLTAAPDGLRERRADIPRSLEAVVLRSLARDPNARFRSAAELRASLLAVDLDASEHPTPPAGVVAPPRPSRHFPARVATALGAVLLLAASAILLTSDDRRPGNTGTPGIAAPADGTVGPAPAAPITFDPDGSDGEENPDLVANLVDGEPGTLWKTDTYQGRPDFGGLKPGVGVYFNLGAARSVRSVEIVTGQTAWSGEVYVADRPASRLDGWGRPAATGSRKFEVGGARGRYVLFWITSLPVAEGGYRLEVAEVKITA